MTVAACHFQVFDKLEKGPLSLADLQNTLGLKPRPAMVMLPALLAMDLLEYTDDGRVKNTGLGALLVSGNPLNLTGYIGLEKNAAGVLAMVNWLKNDGPENRSQGLSYIKDEEAESPMDDPEAALFFTMALAGRARLLSPIVADKVSRSSGCLLDIAGGTGFYAYEWLATNPAATGIVFDRPEVLNTAGKLFEEWGAAHPDIYNSVKDRIGFLPGDMLVDPLPPADIALASSLFHDWPEQTCQQLAVKFAAALNPGGELWIHDAFLNDSLDGPIAVTDYSAMLFLGTKGRAYSRQEYKNWLTEAGLTPSAANMSTMMDYGLLSAVKFK